MQLDIDDVLLSGPVTGAEQIVGDERLRLRPDKTAHNNDVWRTRSDRRTSRRVINQASGGVRPSVVSCLDTAAAAAVAGDASIFGAWLYGATDRSSVTSDVERSLVACSGVVSTEQMYQLPPPPLLRTTLSTHLIRTDPMTFFGGVNSDGEWWPSAY